MKIKIYFKQSFLLLILLMVAAMSSCQRDMLVFEAGKGTKLKPGLNLSISTLSDGGDMSITPGTKAVVSDHILLKGTDLERTVRSLDLFIFDVNGYQLEHSRIVANGNQIDGQSNILFPTSANVYTYINIKDILNSAGFGTRTLAVVANWDDAAMGGVSLKDRLNADGGRLINLESMVIAANFTVNSGVQALPFTAPGLLMFGKSTQTYTSDDDIPDFKINLVRMVARLDLNLKVAGAMSTASQVAEVRVLQAANRAYLEAQIVAFGDSTMPAGTTQPNMAIGLFPNSIIAAHDFIFSHSIYLPENNLKAGTYNSSNATYVLVNIPNGGTDNWYRFWVNEADVRTPNTDNYHIKRNTIYQIEAIIDVRGGATPDLPLDTEDRHFEKLLYTVSYDIQPGMVGVKPAMQRYPSGSTVTVSRDITNGIATDPAPLVFYTTHDESGIIYHPGDQFIIDSNVKLYARLRPASMRRITIGTGSDGQPMLTLTDDPNDGGLLFKYGSTVGLYSAAGQRNMNNTTGWIPFIHDQWSIDDVAFDPRIDGSRPASILNYIDVPYEATAPLIDHIYHADDIVRIEGKGDPCRLVGLTLSHIRSGIGIDNGLWRLPTHAEMVAIFPSPGVIDRYPDTTIPAYKSTGVGTHIYGWFPCSPYRRDDNYTKPDWVFGYTDDNPNHTHFSSSGDLWISGFVYDGIHGTSAAVAYPSIAGIRFCVRR